MSNQPGIRVVTILGTVRPGSYTAKALALVVREVQSHAEAALDQIDPAGLQLPFPGQPTSTDAARVREMVKAATGVILATPEYHGSFSSVTKLIIENLGFPSALAGKPVALLGVAAGQIGAIKSLEALSSVCAHVGAMVLPGPVSVANVQSVFDAEGNCLDAGIEKRIRGVATSLLDYIHGYICPRHTLEAMVRDRAA
ncbi:MAG TPA: NAD(P)H-dependent oxidoreductase [Bryobacteraceae bacterium]|nr:NAD(P)H-dependent oxidoreductase [Bryobacteraceae bacterium]